MNKTIFIYWEQGWNSAPAIVWACRRSWEIKNPSWEVKALSSEDFDDEFFPELGPSMVNSLTVQARSDLIRLKLLKKHGGVWADATCFCAKPLDTWLAESTTEGFFCLERPGRDREISNWFIACSKENLAVVKLYQSLCSFWNKTPFDLESWSTRKLVPLFHRFFHRNRFIPLLWVVTPLARWLKSYPYFIFHYTFFWLVLKDRQVRSIWSGVKKNSCQQLHTATLDFFGITVNG